MRKQFPALSPFHLTIQGYQIACLSIVLIACASFILWQCGLYWDLNLVNQIKWIGLSNILFVIIFSIGSLCCYITFRFNFRFALSILVILLNDFSILLSICSYLKIQIQAITLVYILFVLGCTLYPLLLFFNHIKENFLQFGQSEPVQVINLAMTQILRSTFIYINLVLGISYIIYSFKQILFENFAILLSMTAIFNTFSIFYIASKLVLCLGIQQEHFLKKLANARSKNF